MRKPFVAGNWKMNLDRAGAVELATSIAQAANAGTCDVAVCPPFVYMEAVRQALDGSSVGLGSQDAYHEKSGAYTGEISVQMVADLGCNYAILGHSERRNIFGESNQDVNKKLHAVLEAGIVPIVCVGELLEQREAGQTLEVVKSQFSGSFEGVSAEQMSKCVIAYEPVWAIGTGKVATPDQAEEVHADLRTVIADHYRSEIADGIRIQYGGSVKPDNAKELMAQPNIDGALVGGAALKADSFLAIVAATA